MGIGVILRGKKETLCRYWYINEPFIISNQKCSPTVNSIDRKISFSPLLHFPILVTKTVFNWLCESIYSLVWTHLCNGILITDNIQPNGIAANGLRANLTIIHSSISLLYPLNMQCPFICVAMMCCLKSLICCVCVTGHCEYVQISVADPRYLGKNEKFVI